MKFAALHNSTSSPADFLELAFSSSVCIGTIESSSIWTTDAEFVNALFSSRRLADKFGIAISFPESATEFAGEIDGLSKRGFEKLGPRPREQSLIEKSVDLQFRRLLDFHATEFPSNHRLPRGRLPMSMARKVRHLMKNPLFGVEIVVLLLILLPLHFASWTSVSFFGFASTTTGTWGRRCQT